MCIECIGNFLILRLARGPCTTSSTTRWWPSMSTRTSAGGRTPMVPACPPTGLTSRYLPFKNLSFYSTYDFRFSWSCSTVFFEEWTPETKNKKGKKEVEMTGTIEKRWADLSQRNVFTVMKVWPHSSSSSVMIGVVRVRALYDYAGQETDELSFKAGKNMEPLLFFIAEMIHFLTLGKLMRERIDRPIYWGTEDF